MHVLLLPYRFVYARASESLLRPRGVRCCLHFNIIFDTAHSPLGKKRKERARARAGGRPQRETREATTTTEERRKSIFFQTTKRRRCAPAAAALLPLGLRAAAALLLLLLHRRSPPPPTRPSTGSGQRLLHVAEAVQVQVRVGAVACLVVGLWLFVFLVFEDVG
jgi:hypothetical protein